MLGTPGCALLQWADSTCRALVWYGMVWYGTAALTPKKKTVGTLFLIPPSPAPLFFQCLFCCWVTKADEKIELHHI